MGAAQDLVNAGFVGYQGWGDAEAAANYRATGGAGKQGGGGSSSGGSTLSGFKFDQAAAEKAAMEELRPYYEKLLSIYNGDVNLAKKRMEEDYARGLRYKQEETATGLGDVAATRAERDRKFKIALGDLDQEMNARGLTTSGVKTGEVTKAKADEAYQQELLNRQARDLTTAEKKYTEEANVEKQRFLEEKGFAPSGVTGYISEPEKKKWEQAQEMATKSKNMALMKREQAANDYVTGVTPIATAQPQNWTDVLNQSLKMQGLTPIS